jgi:hypothetical protein
VSVSGSWTDVIRTLRLFETLPYRSAINHIALTTSTLANSKTPGTTQWQLSFDVAASTLVGIPSQTPTATTTSS